MSREMDYSNLFRRADDGDFLIPIVPVPASHKPIITSVCAICLSISWIAVSLRFYTRVFLFRTAGNDDWIMILTVVPILQLYKRNGF
jgi:hypothetical protein